MGPDPGPKVFMGPESAVLSAMEATKGVKYHNQTLICRRISELKLTVILHDVL